MSKIIDAINKKKDITVFVTKCALIVLSLITAIPYLNSWIYPLNKLFCAWTLVLSVYLFFSNIKYYKAKEYITMLLFCVAYGITMVINIKSHFVNEVLIMGYIASSYFMLTYCDRNKTMDDVKKELKTMSYIVVSISFIYSIINLIIYILTYSGWFDLSGMSYIYGMVGNQLGGIYNPNTGATFNYISIILTFFLLMDAKKSKAFLITNIVFQFIGFSLAQSRGAQLCTVAFVILYFAFVWRKKSFKTAKQIIVNTVAVVVSAVIILGATTLLRHGISYVVGDLMSIENVENRKPIVVSPSPSSKPEGNVNKHPLDKDNIDRDFSGTETSDFTTGRMSLWMAAILDLEDKPIFGMGYRGIDDALNRNLTEYDYENSAAGGLHNVYITVLASGGFVGFFIFALLIVFFVLKVLKIYLNRDVPTYVKFLATCIPVWLVGDLVESRIMMSFGFMDVIFWIFAGYLMYYASECDKNGKLDSPSI